MTEPTDETQPHPIALPPAATPDVSAGAPGQSGPVPPAPAAPPPAGPSAAAPPAGGQNASDPGWREPPWFPPRDRDRRDRDRRDRRPGPVAIVVGLALIAIGLYYFVDRTLGIALPRIEWGSLWPVVLIVIGGLILLRSFERRA